MEVPYDINTDYSAPPHDPGMSHDGEWHPSWDPSDPPEAPTAGSSDELPSDDSDADDASFQSKSPRGLRPVEKEESDGNSDASLASSSG